MLFKTAFTALVLLICPLALCYGQVGFSSVHGERGYSALRGAYTWNLDNDWILIPQGAYYRNTDKENEKTGSTSRYGLQVLYEISESWTAHARGIYQPRSRGYEGIVYDAGVFWQPFVRHEYWSDPLVRMAVGQGRKKIYVDKNDAPLNSRFEEVETFLSLQAETSVSAWRVQAAWQKVLQYSETVPDYLSFSWADVPFMTAVIQGFIRETQALRLSYRTDLITPYLSWARYQYTQEDSPAAAVSAGLHVRWGKTTISGGVEVFEPRREANRRTFFSISAETEF